MLDIKPNEKFVNELKKRVGFKHIEHHRCCSTCKNSGHGHCDKWHPIVFNTNGMHSICDYYDGLVVLEE
jgi:hypothetical protein